MEMSTLRDAIREMPFKPFTIRLVDGRMFYVHHPDYLLVPPTKKQTLFFVAHDTESVSILDALMVASIEFGDKRITAQTNGTPGSPH